MIICNIDLHYRKTAQKILNKNINTLDDFKSSSIKALYFKENLRSKTKLLLNKINKLKK